MCKNPCHTNRILFEICQQHDNQENKNSDCHDCSSDSTISNGNAAESNIVNSLDDTIKEDSNVIDPEDFRKG